MTITTTETAVATDESSESISAAGPREGRPVRRHFSTEYKRRILAEYEAAPTGSKGLVLRREGLYDASVKRWREQLEAGTLGRVSTPKPRRVNVGRNLDTYRRLKTEHFWLFSGS